MANQDPAQDAPFGNLTPPAIALCCFNVPEEEKIPSCGDMADGKMTRVRVGHICHTGQAFTMRIMAWPWTGFAGVGLALVFLAPKSAPCLSIEEEDGIDRQSRRSINSSELPVTAKWAPLTRASLCLYLSAMLLCSEEPHPSVGHEICMSEYTHRVVVN